MPDFISEFVDDVFGNSRLDRMHGAYGQMLSRFEELGGTAYDRGQTVISDFLSSMQESIGDYTSNYEDMLAQYQAASGDMLADYRGGWDTAISTYDVGREHTLQAIDQATQAGQRRMTAQNAMTGMGNTSFGQSAVSSIGTQGALQKGIVEEQYSRGLSELHRGRTEGLAGYETRINEQLAGLQGGYANRLAAMQQGTASAAAGMGFQNIGQWANLLSAPLQQHAQMQYQTGAMPTIGESVVEGLAGGIIGGVGNLFGGLF